MKLPFEDFIYGSIDGAVTTFAIVAGVVGASLSPNIILILGFANMFADGFSMAIANYQASKAHNEYVQMKRKREEWEIDNQRAQEEQEIRDIYEKKRFQIRIFRGNCKNDHLKKKSLDRYNDERRARSC